jgi:hypothetical protein
MVDDRRDTVIIEKENSSSPLGWIIGLVVLLLLVIAFFYFGGFGMFSGGATSEGGDVNISVPESIEVQPTTGQ